MTSVEPMTPRQLLELASLDALGLLDDVESAMYTRSFHDAPATVQDEVLRLQGEIANDLQLLPGEEPDPQLRERVLKAVADALALDDSLAPLARIGREQRQRDRDGSRRRGPIRLGGSGQFWRAASFAMAGVSLIMAYFLAIGRQASSELYDAFIWDDTERLAVLLTVPAKEFLLDQSKKINLAPLDDNAEYDATLYVNSEAGRVLILVSDLPDRKGRGYQLQAIAAGSTEPTVLKRFHSPAGFGGVRIDELSTTLLATAIKWQIATIDGTVLLSSS